MKKQETTHEIYRRISSYKAKTPQVPVKPLRSNPYALEGRSIVALVRTDRRNAGIAEALRLLGGFRPVVKELEGYVLVKPNCNSDDSFPGSTHPETLQIVLQLLLDAGLSQDQIVVGDMSGPMWLPTRKTMQTNGTLNIVETFGVKSSFFDDEDWVTVKPDKATFWPQGFTISKTVYEAARVISLPCLKTHRFGGVFTLSLKNSVGILNPADRMHFHRSERMLSLIAEVNLAYTADLVILDGMKCFVSGGPETGEEASPGIIIAGGDRVAVDAVGVSVLQSLDAHGIATIPVKKHEQLMRGAEIGLGYLNPSMIELRTSNLSRAKDFPQLVHYIKHPQE